MIVDKNKFCLIFVTELFETKEKHSRLKLFARFLSVPYFDFLFRKQLIIKEVI